MKSKIIELFGNIKKIVLPQKIVEAKSNTSNEITPISNELVAKFSAISSMWQEQMKSIGSLFPSSKVLISDDAKQIINVFAQENNIFLENGFFDIGDLMKQQQPFGGGLYGIGQSYELVGSDDEKNKYELTRQLRWKIEEYIQYLDYFEAIDDKFYVELALSNFGTNFDEDVDVKVFFKKGLISTKDTTPIPGKEILQMMTKAFDSMYKSKRTVYVDDYSGYPILPRQTLIPTIGYKDNVERQKIEFKSILNATFCYDYFQDDDCDILCYNLQYIKQNTSIFFPTILIFNEVPEHISYEISSKHYPEIIKGELIVLQSS